MSIPKEAKKVKLIGSLFSSEEELIEKVVKQMERCFGPVDWVSEKLVFNRTRYYEKEMGWPLYRRFISFSKLIWPDSIADIKLMTNAIENEYLVEKRRKINIDPGYTSLERLVLATGKNYVHRIYLKKGIYADLTLVFHAGTFKPLAWTYPDYGDEKVIGYFNRVRNCYLQDLREEEKRESQGFPRFNREITMLKSMTAYGRAESLKGTMEFIVEIRSGNYRYREIVPRIPQSLQPFEDRIRPIVTSRLKRGRIEISIQIKDNGDKGLKLELNRPLVKAYGNILNELNKELGYEQPIDLSFFSQLKDSIIVKQDSVDLEKIWPDLKDVIDKALLSLDIMRINEGKALEKDFLERLDRIGAYIDEIRNRAKVTVETYRDKLRQRIHQLIEASEINEDRLVQEVAFMAERSDVTEELIRVESHLEQFRNYMNQDDVIGRRLDFISQEINREVNTIGSKAADSFISHRVVEIKAELEKLREQIQNVE